MRAFIFSLDSFVAFTLALVAIYSLIFFSSVPSSYYYLLTQTHYLSRDVLISLSTAECDTDYYDYICPTTGPVLDNIIAENNPQFRDILIQDTIGDMVPEQFGYRLEVSEDEGEKWRLLYDTADHDDGHATVSKKLSVSSHVVVFGYSATVNKLTASPYNYLTCRGEDNLEEALAASGGGATAGVADWGLIICGIEITGTDGDGNPIYQERGNIHPRDILGGGGDLVPSADAKVVRFTVYI